MTTFESIYRFFGWWIINIDLFLVVLLLLAAGLLLLKRYKCGRRLLFLSCFGFAFLGIVPVGLWTFENLENRFPKIDHIPSDAKGMILLGGPFDVATSMGREERAYNLTLGRFVKFVELAKKYPHLQLVFTGTPFEVEKLKDELTDLGFDARHVLFEGESKDTKGNAAKTAELLKPKSGEKWVLLTSAYHMPRSVGLFRKAGFDVIPYPADYHSPGNYEMWFFLGLKMNLDAWHTCSREWLGMMINYLMDRSDEVYPKPSNF